MTGEMASRLVRCNMIFYKIIRPRVREGHQDFIHQERGICKKPSWARPQEKYIALKLIGMCLYGLIGFSMLPLEFYAIYYMLSQLGKQ